MAQYSILAEGRIFPWYGCLSWMKSSFLLTYKVFINILLLKRLLGFCCKNLEWWFFTIWWLLNFNHVASSPLSKEVTNKLQIWLGSNISLLLSSLVKMIWVTCDMIWSPCCLYICIYVCSCFRGSSFPNEYVLCLRMAMKSCFILFSYDFMNHLQESTCFRWWEIPEIWMRPVPLAWICTLISTLQEAINSSSIAGN